jgi:signal transduction histidine kinase
MFFQNITHEFRTPLTLIIGPLDSILNSESSSLSEPLRHQLMVIEENAKRLLHLVNQLLDLSKIEGKKMKLRACETDFVEFCKRIVAVYHSYAERKKIELTLATQTESLLLHIDQEKIEKVMHNLLSNAFKFVKPGGDITISVSGPIDVSLIEKNKGFIKSGILKVVQIKVKNTGIGIPSDALSSIFERFRQVDDSSTRNTEGTGIGLSLVKEYVELHYGAIDVCSELGKYTEFSVFLPFGKSHFKENEIISGTADASISDYVTLLPADKDTGKQEESYSDTGVQAVHGHEKLLIVEDNDDMIQYIKDVLKNNYAIYEAKNGEEGLARALHILPDLIISDVMMPKMDGSP